LANGPRDAVIAITECLIFSLEKDPKRHGVTAITVSSVRARAAEVIE
jgi:hypothetical protein